jgi:hypothetical protein
MRNEWKNMVRDILLDDDENYFIKSYIEKLLRLHANPVFDQSRKLFSILVFKVWVMKHMTNN